MPSPSGIFVGLTQSELDDLRTSAIARIQSGERTGLSGGGKSGQKNWQMSPQDVLFEINYAEKMLGNTPRAQKVVSVLNDQYPVDPYTQS